MALTHGNGPQVGLLANRAARVEEGPRFPLDVLSAASLFVERTGAFAGFGALEDAAALLPREAGTRIRPAG